MKKLCFGLAFMLCISQTSIHTVVAKGTEDDDSGKFDTYEQYVNSPNYYGETHQEELKQKVEELELYKAEHNPNARDAVRLKMPGYLQENSWYCGPATVQNAIKYTTGKKISQSTLANKSNLNTTKNEGTYVNKVTKVLRKYTGITYTEFINSQWNFYSPLQAATQGGNRPVIFNVNTKALNKSYPFSSGHYVLGTGFATNGANINSVYYFDVFYLKQVTGDRSCTKAVMNDALNKGTKYYIW